MKANEWDTSYEWKAVTLLALGFGLVGLDRWLIAPLFPSIAYSTRTRARIPRRPEHRFHDDPSANSTHTRARIPRVSEQ